MSSLTTHAFSATASDPDGDAITYNWDFGNGTTSTNSAPTVTFNNASTTTYRVTLTVSDSKGATVKSALASSSVSVVSTTMAGTWAGTMPGIGPMTASMTQYLGGLVTGTWEIPTRGDKGEIGPTGEPGKIQANGQFELRFKVRVGSFVDFYFRGTMDPTGQRLTGTLQGSGFTGQVMELIKQ